ncbi:hypothetical protein KBY58_10020 [Cyanobium sp. HWJ4-Hawea]|nr:hypothetical protein [Cyanobium sp. HWJ4-Hawea]
MPVLLSLSRCSLRVEAVGLPALVVPVTKAVGIAGQETQGSSFSQQVAVAVPPVLEVPVMRDLVIAKLADHCHDHPDQSLFPMGSSAGGGDWVVF